MKKMLTETKRVLAVLMLAVLTAACMTACASGASNTEDRKPWRPPVDSRPSENTVVQTPAAPVDQEPVQTPEKTDPPVNDTGLEQPVVENAAATVDPASIQGVARIGDLVGNYAMDLFFDHMGTYIIVDTESGHNPYDLTWRYGPDVEKRKEVNAENWDGLYRSYVATCDWSLVFDAEYYKQAFPMLAKLYHENDELLLEHFQTQGIHEGRQASRDFNVAAYMDNCDNKLVAAFGENYECYYFYYMLNQNTQKSVNTSNTNSAYPRWLTLELSLQQYYEHKGVNGHRDDVNVQPVILDPETIALANYRAWYDAEHNLYAHEWTTDKATGPDVNDCLWRLSRDHFAENTVKWYLTNGKEDYNNFATRYKNSPKHYEAMVSSDYAYFGCSNPYWSNNPDNPYAKNGVTGYVCQFDLFTAVQPQTPYELD